MGTAVWSGYPSAHKPDISVAEIAHDAIGSTPQPGNVMSIFTGSNMGVRRTDAFNTLHRIKARFYEQGWKTQGAPQSWLLGYAPIGGSRASITLSFVADPGAVGIGESACAIYLFRSFGVPHYALPNGANTNTLHYENSFRDYLNRWLEYQKLR